DTGISSQFSVTFWAKGAPGGGSWNPWISKYGENGVGWQYRIGTDAGRPVWTVRDNSSGAFIDGAMGPSWSRGGDQDDMHASFVVANTDIWHFYVGTYDVTTGIRKLYVDGVYGGGESGNAQYTTAPSSHVAIGARDSGGGSFAPHDRWKRRRGWQQLWRLLHRQYLRRALLQSRTRHSRSSLLRNTAVAASAGVQCQTSRHNRPQWQAIRADVDLRHVATGDKLGGPVDVNRGNIASHGHHLECSGYVLQIEQSVRQTLVIET
ncbi:MAG TPA: LamG-like jellyroll fold domain-containing protein, partial [Verrucomicrobiae bacterium]